MFCLFPPPPTPAFFLEEEKTPRKNPSFLAKSAMKRRSEDGEAGEKKRARGLGRIGEDLLFEVLKHADAATLGRAACVCRLWRSAAEDERLWEGVCTRHWANLGCGPEQLRAVVLALGGFRRLHALYLRPLLKQRSSSSSSSSSSPSSSSTSSSSSSFLFSRWGKDEVHLSLCLYSIRHFNDKISRARGWSWGVDGVLFIGGYWFPLWDFSVCLFSFSCSEIDPMASSFACTGLKFVFLPLIQWDFDYWKEGSLFIIPSVLLGLKRNILIGWSVLHQFDMIRRQGDAIFLSIISIPIRGSNL